MNRRIAALDTEIAELLAEHENPLEDPGASHQLAATIIMPRLTTPAASAAPAPSLAFAGSTHPEN